MPKLKIFIDWIKADTTHRFVDIYTDHGGTDGESHNMLKLLAEQNIPFFETEESNNSPKLMHDNRIVYIHSLHEHNDIIQNPDNVIVFLENNPFLEELK